MLFMFLRSPAILVTGDDSFLRSPRAKFGVEARTFADKTLYRVGRAWHGRAAAGARVALARAVPKWGILKQA